MSSLNWLDFSESDQDKALEIIELFREKGTVDELGVGTVRDGLASLLFPGTSTIMTRARYYLFVPWIYLRHEYKETKSNEIARKARADEIALIDGLVEAGESVGVIGIEARSTLKRLPSTVYWQGLGVLGIRRFNGSREIYHRSLDRFHRDGGNAIRGEDGHVVVGGYRRNWDPNLPPASKGFPSEASLALTEAEATYLRERIQHAAPESLFAFFARNPTDLSDVNFPWEHPSAKDAPAKALRVLAHAEQFSLAMHGAALLYNLMLARKSDNDELADVYERLLEQWTEEVQSNWDKMVRWDRGALWADD